MVDIIGFGRERRHRLLTWHLIEAVVAGAVAEVVADGTLDLTDAREIKALGEVIAEDVEQMLDGNVA